MDKYGIQTKLNKEQIEEQKKHFQSLRLLPLIIGALISGAGLLGGIGMAFATKSIVMFFSLFISGVITGGLLFFLLRILISSQILTVLYLEKISYDFEDIKQSKAEQPAIKDIEEQLINKISVICEPKRDTQKETALNELADVVENSDIYDFCSALDKWNVKFGNELLYWDLTLYNKMISFFNSINRKEYTDEQGKRQIEYIAEDKDLDNIKASVTDFLNKNK